MCKIKTIKRPTSSSNFFQKTKKRRLGPGNDYQTHQSLYALVRMPKCWVCSYATVSSCIRRLRIPAKMRLLSIDLTGQFTMWSAWQILALATHFLIQGAREGRGDHHSGRSTWFHESSLGQWRGARWADRFEWDDCASTVHLHMRKTWCAAHYWITSILPDYGRRQISN